MKIRTLLQFASAAFFFACPALAQNAGTVTNHAFALGKGAGVTGYTSLLCTSAQLAVGQAAADPICRTLSGDVTIDAAGVTAIGANKVTNAQFRQSGALSLVGRSANSTGNVADISATPASSCVFMESASTLTCASIATANIAANAVTNAKLATMAANTVKANATGGSAVPTDVTAVTARSSSLLNVDSYTGHGDSIYTILATDRTVGTNAAFTASRTWTLPAANAVNPGQEIIIADFQGTVTGSNTLVISRAGADTINGVTSVTIVSANGAYLLKSDGTSKWTAQALGAAAAGGVSSVTCGTGLSGGTITTSGTCALALTNATLQANPTAPGTTTSAAVMAGLGGTCKITPVYSGRVMITMNQGYFQTGGTSSGFSIQLRYGTGVAPAALAATTGTTLGNIVTLTSTAGNTYAVSRSGILTGLTPGTAYWFDESFGSNNGSTVGLNAIDCNVQEF